MSLKGRYESNAIDLTSSGTTQAKLVATADLLTFSGTLGTNDITLRGVLAPTNLDDAVNKGYLETVSVGIYGYDSVGGQAISTTSTGIVFNNSVIADTGLSLNTGTGVVTITNAGRYQISYWVQCESLDNTGASQATMTGQVETDPAGGTSWGVKAGSLSSALYDKNGTTGLFGYGCGKTILIDAVAGETLRVTFFRNSPTTTAQTRANESSISITRMGQ